ncbi:MAG TPA: hypothetical protein VNQ79_04050 [Blastocatellia bacterium]|nr:hypothetical protein [Blastocatellia bacterium]
MNDSLVNRIARAVLYEGYILYPYRPSALKNRQRFNFGVLAPQAYSEAQRGAESWTMQTECLVQGAEEATVSVTARFLHLREAAGSQWQSWQEAVEREVKAEHLKPGELAAQPQHRPFSFPATSEQAAVSGAMEISATRIAERLHRLTVRLFNLTPFANANQRPRDEALRQSMLSTHTILSVQRGEFISLLEPPTELSEAAAACHNAGTWPVLTGEEGERDCLLSSPIILYDYPQIAPESAGDFFDGAEIDEMLALRVLTLTDEESLRCAAATNARGSFSNAPSRCRLNK